MDELKDLVIQSLETKGVLGQLRAQLRSCVFKCIDEQDQQETGRSSFHWENPHARKASTSASGMIMCELIKDVLEFYKMDYTLNIFGPEANLPGKATDKQDLARRAKLEDTNQSQPILLQILESFMSGDRAAAPPQPQPILDLGLEKKEIPGLSLNAQKARPSLRQNQHDDGYNQFGNKKENKFHDMGDSNSSDQEDVEESVEQRMQRADKLLDEVKREEKRGFELDMQKKSPGAAIKRDKPTTEESDIADNYEDDFDEDIEEDLPDSVDHEQDPMQEEQQQRDQAAVTGSGGYGITVSQSLGVDPSVDSLALEDYDHVEPVERV